MEQTWTSKQYRSAAEVHFNTCNFMLKNIEQEKKYKAHVYLDIYYLSGYILECILKYYILERKHKDKVTKKELDDLNLKNHKIYNLWILACDVGKIRKEDFKWSNLTKEWSEELRYEAKFQDIKEIMEHYHQTVVPIYNKIKNKH